MKNLRWREAQQKKSITLTARNNPNRDGDSLMGHNS